MTCLECGCSPADPCDMDGLACHPVGGFACSCCVGLEPVAWPVSPLDLAQDVPVAERYL